MLFAPVARPECRGVESGNGPAGPPTVRAEKVVTGLEVPWAIVFLPNGDWLVNERHGRIRRVTGGRTLVPQSVATIEVDDSAESGLLGITLHPDFGSNRLFYIYYTTVKSGRSVNRVERYRLSEDGATATPERLIIDDIPASPLHDGGRIHFGPDRMLYIGTGDGRQPPLAQDPSSLAGKILRLDADGGIPADNPRPGNPLYVLGIRNTQGFGWTGDGTLVVSDHGPSGELGRTGGDEVSYARAGDNLGWPTIWKCETRAGFVTPAIAWNDALPPGGALVYRGGAIPGWDGSFILATLLSKELRRIELTPPNVGTSEGFFTGEFGRLREITQSPDGTLYVTTSNCDGRGICPSEGDAVLRILQR
jgi:glucose/arabinose dehydrogenase